MDIIDAHHHLWCPNSDNTEIGYQWLTQIGVIRPFGDPSPIQRDYLAPELLAESTQHQIISSVHIQCDGTLPDPVKESLWLDKVRQTHNLPQAQVGFIDLSADAPESVLSRYVQIDGFKGVRQILSRLDQCPEISFAGEHYLDNPKWRSQFPILAESGLTFDLQCYPEQLTIACNFFSQHPNIPFVIDHCASPYDQTPEGLKLWQKNIEQAAQLPHCYIKLSGFGMFDKYWNAKSIQSMFDHVVKLFTPQRIMFGSNFPVDKLMRSYDFIVEQLLQCAKNTGLSKQDIQQIFVNTAKQFYRLS